MNKKLLKVTTGIIAAAVATPIIIGVSATVGLIAGTYMIINETKNSCKFKDLKDGSIVEINGQYYEVVE